MMDTFTTYRLTALRAAKAEAHRFLAAAALAETVLTTAHIPYSSKEVAAAKRASLDLSRALSVFRNVGRTQ